MKSISFILFLAFGLTLFGQESTNLTEKITLQEFRELKPKGGGFYMRNAMTYNHGEFLLAKGAAREVKLSDIPGFTPKRIRSFGGDPNEKINLVRIYARYLAQDSEGKEDVRLHLFHALGLSGQASEEAKVGSVKTLMSQAEFDEKHGLWFKDLYSFFDEDQTFAAVRMVVNEKKHHYDINRLSRIPELVLPKGEGEK